MAVIEIEVKDKATVKLDNIARKTKQADRNTKDLEEKITSLNTQVVRQRDRLVRLSNAWSGFKDRIRSAKEEASNSLIVMRNQILTYVGLEKAIRGVYSSYTSLENKTMDIAKTTGLSGDKLKELTDSYKRLATTTAGYDLQGLYEIGAIAGQLGIKGVENIQKFTKAISQMASTSVFTAEEAGTAFATLSNQLGEPISNIERLTSAVTLLASNTTATEKDVIYYADRITAMGKTFGLASSQILGLGVTLKDLGINAELGGTAVSQMLVKLKTDTEKITKALGIDFKQFERDLTDKPIRALKTFLTTLNQFDEKSKLAILKDIKMDGAGALQTILKLSSGFNKLEDNIRVAQMGYDSANATQKEFDIQAQTLEKRLAVIRAKAVVLGETFGAMLAPATIDVANALGGVIDFAKRNADSIATLTKYVVGLGVAWKTLNVIISMSPLGRAFGLVSAIGSGIAYIVNQEQKRSELAKSYDMAKPLREQKKNLEKLKKAQEDYASNLKQIKQFEKNINDDRFKGNTLALNAFKRGIENLKKANMNLQKDIKNLSKNTKIKIDITANSDYARKLKEDIEKLNKDVKLNIDTNINKEDYESFLKQIRRKTNIDIYTKVSDLDLKKVYVDIRKKFNLKGSISLDKKELEYFKREIEKKYNVKIDDRELKKYVSNVKNNNRDIKKALEDRKNALIEYYRILGNKEKAFKLILEKKVKKYKELGYTQEQINRLVKKMQDDFSVKSENERLAKLEEIKKKEKEINEEKKRALEEAIRKQRELEDGLIEYYRIIGDNKSAFDLELKHRLDNLRKVGLSEEKIQKVRLKLIQEYKKEHLKVNENIKLSLEKIYKDLAKNLGGLLEGLGRNIAELGVSRGTTATLENIGGSVKSSAYASGNPYLMAGAFFTDLLSGALSDTNTLIEDIGVDNAGLKNSIDYLNNSIMFPHLELTRQIRDNTSFLNNALTSSVNRLVANGNITGNSFAPSFSGLGTQGIIGDLADWAGGTLGGLISGVANAFYNKSKSLESAGIEFQKQTVEEFSKEAKVTGYQLVKTTKKYLFGAFKSVSYSKDYFELDESLKKGLSEALGASVSNVIESGTYLGVKGLEDRLKDMTIDLGNIKIDGKSAEEIKANIEGAYTTQLDNLVQETMGNFLDRYREAGQSYYETLIKLAIDVEQGTQLLQNAGIEAIKFKDMVRYTGNTLNDFVKSSILASEKLSNIKDVIVDLNGSAENLIDTYKTLIEINNTLNLINSSSNGISKQLITLAGSVEEFKRLQDSYVSNFAGDTEKLVMYKKEIENITNRAFAFDSIEDYKNKIKSLDLNLQTGRESFIKFLKAGDLVKKYFDLEDKINKDRVENLKDYDKNLEELLKQIDISKYIVSDDFNVYVDRFKKFFSDVNEFSSLQSNYISKFLDDNQKIDFLYKDLEKGFNSISRGFFAENKEDFIRLVQMQNLDTDVGVSNYKKLLELANTADEYYKLKEKLSKKEISSVEEVIKTAEELRREAEEIYNANKLLNDSLFGLTNILSQRFSDVKALKDKFFSIGNLNSLQNSFISNFYTDEENKKFLEQYLKNTLSLEGLELPNSREAFKELVRSIDITSSDGIDTYKKLLEVSDLASKYYSYLEDIANNASEVVKQEQEDSLNLLRDTFSKIEDKFKSIVDSFSNLANDLDKTRNDLLRGFTKEAYGNDGIIYLLKEINKYRQLAKDEANKGIGADTSKISDYYNIVKSNISMLENDYSYNTPLINSLAKQLEADRIYFDRVAPDNIQEVKIDNDTLELLQRQLDTTQIDTEETRQMRKILIDIWNYLQVKK